MHEMKRYPTDDEAKKLICELVCSIYISYFFIFDRIFKKRNKNCSSV